MYDPKGNSRDRAIDLVQFTETEPPAHLGGIVHRFLELRTTEPLPADYRFHALPDACTYIIFDQSDAHVAGLTKLQASAEELNLGRTFHFINIRFLPGVWQADKVPVGFGQIDDHYAGDLPLIAMNSVLIRQGFDASQTALVSFVDDLVARGLVVANPVTEQIFAQMDDIFTVADMAEICALSPRQLQRNLKRTTGFTPHDFLKVLRLQQALKGEPSLSYADQSHFIHSFRKATGYTPGKYAKKFDV
ncbi:helix-turn-helix domain-containing protein [Yoonia sp. 208BN28-4]|uniref:helix-turn-helix domain-containing protein n=1 Tax=Yoonia sp. 208BN28-4 TaxID=3126505 RepID=UPI0030A2FF07